MPDDLAPPDDDLIETFQLDASRLRGRVVRLGPVLDDILGRHAYPEPVARLLGKALVHTALLAGMLKYEGVFTLQTKGDGPVPLLVADMTSAGALRGYAKVAAGAALSPGDAADLLGTGYLAFTVDQGEAVDRYQGIVELQGPTLEDCVRHYFRQSEQIVTGVRVAAARTSHGWRGGGVMLQLLPEDGPAPMDVEDAWRRAMLLLETCSDTELLDPELPADGLIWRLFHEEEPRVWPPTPIMRGCRCSAGRVARILASLPREEVAEFKVDGRFVMTCEFCSTSYSFNDADLGRIRADAE